MIGWLIFGGIVLLVVFLLSLSVSLKFVYENDIDFKITYFIFTLYPVKKSKRKKKDKQRNKIKNKEKNTKNSATDGSKKESEDNPEKDPEKELIKKAVPGKKVGTDKNTAEKKSTFEKMDIAMIRELIESLAHPFGRLLKKIRFNDIYVNSVVRADDAAVAAINYGLQCAAVASLLAYIGSVSKINVREIKIAPDFENYTDSGVETDLYVRCKIKIRLASLIVFAAVSIWRYMKRNLKKTYKINATENISQTKVKKEVKKTVKQK